MNNFYPSVNTKIGPTKRVHLFFLGTASLRFPPKKKDVFPLKKKRSPNDKRKAMSDGYRRRGGGTRGGRTNGQTGEVGNRLSRSAGHH